MANQTTPPLQCQLLCACGCAYLIDNSTEQNSYTYTPDTIFAPVCGWTNASPPATNPSVFVGAGSENDNAALVGTMTIAGSVAIVVAFQGTLPPALTITSIKDWLSDLMGTPEQEGNLPGLVHNGIYGSVNYIYNGIVEEINTLQITYPDAPLYITGHSKGGGMASLFAAMLYFNKSSALQSETAVYTFASPMIGNQDFVSGFLNSPIPVTRFENYLDIVPFLSPSSQFYSLLENAPVNALPHTTFEGTLLCEGLVAALILAGDKNGAWGYVPLGTLNFIEQDGTISGGPNNTDQQIAIAFASGQWSEVFAAHSHLCGAGYMNGTCGSNVNCNGAS